MFSKEKKQPELGAIEIACGGRASRSRSKQQIFYDGEIAGIANHQLGSPTL
jgi:hypothetical protein